MTIFDKSRFVTGLHNAAYYVMQTKSVRFALSAGKAEVIFADRKDINMDTNNSCGCLGYGYVPVQQLAAVYNAEDALKNGSLFPELVLTIEEYGKVCKGGCEE